MKIGRFTLFFGVLSILLTACAGAAKTATVAPTVYSLTPIAPVPTDNDTPITFPANTPVLVWQRTGGIAGFCDDVTVFANGDYTVKNCKTSSTQTGQLSASQLLQLTRLVNKLQSFINENSNPPDVADAMSVKTTFKGAGPLEAGQEDIAALSNFAALLVGQVASAGAGYPVAVSKALDFLAAELSLPVGGIKVISIEAVEWSDRCLGVVTIGIMCAQGITPGYRVVLHAQGQLYELHTDESGESIRLFQ